MPNPMSVNNFGSRSSYGRNFSMRPIGTNKMALYGQYVETGKRVQSKSLQQTSKNRLIYRCGSPSKFGAWLQTENSNFQNSTKLDMESTRRTGKHDVTLQDDSLPVKNMLQNNKNVIDNENLNSVSENMKNMMNQWFKEALDKLKKEDKHINKEKLNKKKTVGDSCENSYFESGDKQETISLNERVNQNHKLKKEVLKLKGFCKNLLTDSNDLSDEMNKTLQEVFYSLENIKVLLKCTKQKSGKVKKDYNKCKSSGNTQNENLKKVCFKNADKSETDLSSLDSSTCNKSNNLQNHWPYNKNAKEFQQNVLEKSKPAHTKRHNYSDYELEKNGLIAENKGKLIIGEILSYPKIDVKSRCTVRIHEKFVEEQIVLNVFKIRNKHDKEESVNQNLGNFKSISTGKVTSSLSYTNSAAMDHSNQTLESSDHLKMHAIKRNASSQTGLYEALVYQNEFSRVSINNFNDEVETMTWESDNISNVEDLFYKTEDDTTIPIPIEETIIEKNKTSIEKADNQLCKRLFNGLECIANSGTLLSATAVNVPPLSFTACDEIPNASSWTLHGAKIRNLCKDNENFRTISSLDVKKSCIVKNIQKDTFINNKIEENKVTSKLPPFGPSSNRVRNLTAVPNLENSDDKMTKFEISCRDIKESLKKDAPLPENLSNLYERLSKLQKMLECIPEDRIMSTLDALEQFDNISSNSPSMTPTPLTNLNQDFVNNVTGLTNGSLGLTENVNGLLEFSNDTDKSECEYDEQKMNIELPDDKSEVTTSLSMLENLIDDFLTKNGLTNLPCL